MHKLTSKILAEILLTFACLTSIGVQSHSRGPHHPKGTPVKVEHGHHHYVPHRQGTEGHQTSEVLTHDKELLHDKEHLKDDLGEWIFENGQNPTEEEMEFHYFKVHDFDNNSKLDGLEILQALSHILPTSAIDAEEFPDVAGESGKRSPKRKREDDFNYYVGLIDKVLQQDDVDNDGYLSYAEYVVGRRSGQNSQEKIKRHY